MSTIFYSKIHKIKLTKNHLSTLNTSKKIISNFENNFLNKIKLHSVKKHKNETFKGRCVWTESSFIFVSDPYKTVKFTSNLDIKIKSGDLVEIKYQKKKKELIALNIINKNQPLNNPIENSKSVFSKVLKDDRKIVNTLRKRSFFYRGIHDFFQSSNFIEINTPTLVESPGVEKYLETFSTDYIEINGNKKTFFMPTSPEFSLKEALTSGIDNIYELSKSFRNSGEYSSIHRPEFIMLEWYRAYQNIEKIILDTAELFLYLSKLINKSNITNYKKSKIDLSVYKIFTLKEIFKYDNIDLDNYSLKPEEFVSDIVNVLKCEKGSLTKEDLFFKYMLEKVEPNIGYDCPVFLIDYPYEMTPLSEKCENPLYGKRFEAYICGIEIANGYGELIDPIIQEKRFYDVIEERKLIGGSSLPFPNRFINALKEGIPPCSGIALGTERLFMILLGIDDIADTKLIDILN